MKAREVIETGIPAGHELLMQGRDQGECGPVGTIGSLFIGKRGGVNVIMANGPRALQTVPVPCKRSPCPANGPRALQTVPVHQQTEFSFQRTMDL